MDLIQKTREFLANEKIDYLLVNATNEFLVEYPALSENSRYFLTNFTGSTGDALISQKDLFLFVDGRYHEQADSEVDKNKVKVVKMKMSQTFSTVIAEKIKPCSIFALVAKKIPQGFLELLTANLKSKNITFRLLDFDPVIYAVEQKNEEKLYKIEQVSAEIVGLTADEKFEKISKTLKSNEAIFTANLEEVSYLCNLRDFAVNYSSKVEAKCIIKKDFATLFTDQPIKSFSDKFKIQKLETFEAYVNKLDSVKKIIIDKKVINAYDFKLLESKSKSIEKNLLKEMKSIKTESEINHYKTCFEKTDKAVMATRDFIENFDANKELSECAITQKLEEEFYKNGAKSLSFKSIVAIGKNSALAHYSKCSKTDMAYDGKFILIDCGAYYEGGYATDITRVFVKGKPTKLQKEVYTIVLKGFLAAFNKKVTPETSGYDLDKTARKILDANAPKGFAFSHALGHGIGINVHEAPPVIGISVLAKEPIKPNMCFTIEPGLYKKGFGGVRLENSCYLAEEDSKLIIKSFTNMCFEEKLIDFSLLTKREQNWLKAFDVR